MMTNSGIDQVRVTRSDGFDIINLMLNNDSISGWRVTINSEQGQTLFERMSNIKTAPPEPLPSPSAQPPSTEWSNFLKWEKFTEWVGAHYIRLHGWWVANYSDQRDSANWRSTQQLWEFYNKQNQGT